RCCFPSTSTTSLYTLSLHDALPISCRRRSSSDSCAPGRRRGTEQAPAGLLSPDSKKTKPTREHRKRPCGVSLVSLLNSFQQKPEDRKSTRLNSSHEWISYAVFCLKK